MPIKRRQQKDRHQRITPEAVTAYRNSDWLGLHRALGLKPWETSPLDAADPNPVGTKGTAGHESHTKARELRAILEGVVNG